MIVMDCSAATAIAFGTPEGNAFASLMKPDEDVLAPSWFLPELYNSVWKYVHAGALDKASALERIQRGEALITRYESPEAYKDEAFDAAVGYDQSYCDMLYMCLARRNSATLFTLDKRLVKTCIEAKVNCIEVVDF